MHTISLTTINYEESNKSHFIIIFVMTSFSNNELIRSNYESTEPVFKVLSLLEACFDLISSPSPTMKIQIMGGKIIENLGFESPLWKVKNFFVLFLFIFKFSIKISYINKNKHFQHVLFDF